jgi:hypothetical protein
MQRNFEPMRKQVEAWQKSELTDVTEQYQEFRSRTIWSLSNAFTSAFKELDPIPQFKTTAKLGEFLETRFFQSF